MAKQPPKAPDSNLIGRNAITGRLETVKEALKHPRTSTVEHMPHPGIKPSGGKKGK